MTTFKPFWAKRQHLRRTVALLLVVLFPLILPPLLVLLHWPIVWSEIKYNYKTAWAVVRGRHDQ